MTREAAAYALIYVAAGLWLAAITGLRSVAPILLTIAALEAAVGDYASAVDVTVLAAFGLYLAGGLAGAFAELTAPATA